MSRFVSRPVLVIGCIGLALIGLGGFFFSGMGVRMMGGMTIDHGWTIPSLGEAPTAAVYVTIGNGGRADRLISARTPVAGRADLHSHRLENGIIMMQQLEAIDIPADTVVSMQPGALHIMLFDLTSPLEDGQTFPLTLMFEQGGTRETTIHVHWPEDSHSGHAH